MSPSSERLSYLLNRYVSNLSTEEEVRELFVLLKKEDGGEAFRDKVRELWNDPNAESLPPTDWNKIYDQVVSIPVIRRRKIWPKIAVAATVLILVGTAIFFFTRQQGQTDQSIAKLSPANDALPGRNKASLTLASGEVVVLDSAMIGKLTRQAGLDVLNHGNGISYAGSENYGETVFNTLTTQNGEQYSLELSDGTKLWLNAASSVRFPVAFTQNTREVEVTGEVYFEVAHDANRPFIVKKPKGDLAVKVLGTHFNVNAYDDEPGVMVTLLEGSVEVRNKNEMVRIVPGEQAIATNNEQLTVNRSADIGSVMAWKNGLFSFNHTDLRTMLRQLARWYDVEVVFEGEVPDRKIGGGITRNTNLSQVLKILEELNIQSRVEGKKLIVGK